MNYETIKGKLGNRASRKVGNNTYLKLRENGSIAVRLHETDILTFQENGDIVLDSGGWKTSTTKARMNNYIPGGIYANKGIWYYTQGYPENRSEFPYADGMIIHADGTVSGMGKDPKADVKLRKQIRQYAKRYIAELRAGNVPRPSAGDCFYCVMREVKTGIPLGELRKDKEHILSHMKESYFVPSLLLRAMEVMPCSQVMGWAVAEVWSTDKVGSGWSGDEFIWTQLEKILARYIMRQLGMVS